MISWFPLHYLSADHITTWPLFHLHMEGMHTFVWNLTVAPICREKNPSLLVSLKILDIFHFWDTRQYSSFFSNDKVQYERIFQFHTLKFTLLVTVCGKINSTSLLQRLALFLTVSVCFLVKDEQFLHQVYQGSPGIIRQKRHNETENQKRIGHQ